MPLAHRIAAAFSILLFILVALAGYNLAIFGELSKKILQVSTSSRAALEYTLDIEGSLIELSKLTEGLEGFEALEGAGEFGDAAEDYREAIQRVRGSIGPKILNLIALELSEEEVQEATILAEIWDDHLMRVPLRELRGTLAQPAREQGTFVNQSLLPTQRQLEKLQVVIKTTLSGQDDAVTETFRRAEIAAQVASLVGLVAALLGSLVVGRTILRPLRRVARGARALAEGDFTYRVPESGGEEMVALARDFNTMAARISQLDQLKKDLVSNVSHDLKAPLASMQETTRLLLEELPGPLNPQQIRLLHLNLSSGERLFRMISDLLDLSRLEAGVESRSFERLNLGALLRTSVEELENLLKEREQRFDLALPKSLVEVEGIPTALGQILTNLLSNALKFTPRGGELGARLEPFAAPPAGLLNRLAPSVREAAKANGGSTALLEVWDSGPGVPDAHKERIFQRFHRVDSHRKGAQGTGLGLAIAAAIATQHHGALWVEDRPEGGSSFKLLLWRDVPTVEFSV